MSCSYCPNSVAKRIETGVMDEGLYHEIIAQLEALNFSGRISYDFYNEPLLVKDLAQKVAYTKEKLPKCNIEIYSNGSLLTKESLDRYFECGVDKFVITRHEDGQKGSGDFEQLYSGLDDSLKAKIEYKNWKDLHLTNRGGCLDDVGGVTQKLLPCYIPHHIVTITVKGNIVPCFEDFYQKNQMGNILETPLIDIWNSQKYSKFRDDLKLGQRHLYEACKQCNRVQVLPIDGEGM